MRRHTASGIALALACGWSYRPDVVLPPATLSDRADLGTEAHAAIASTIDAHDNTPFDDRKLSPEARALWAAWRAEWWHGRTGLGEKRCDDDWRAEVPFAVDPFTGRARELSSRVARDYDEVAPNEIAGTADAVLSLGDVVEIVDWKTGREAPEASGNAQLLTLALAATLACGVTRARIAIVHVRPDGVRVDQVEVDDFDLDVHRRKLAAMLVASLGAQPVAGPHCRAFYCPAIGTCPATSGALEQVAPRKARLPLVLDAKQIESPEHARELYEFARFAQAKLGYLFQALREYTDSNGAIDLGDGRTFGPHTSKRESISLDAQEAIDAVRRELGPHADKALEYSTTKAAIRIAAREFAAQSGEKIAAVERRVLEALRAVSAIHESISTKHEETKAKKEIAA